MNIITENENLHKPTVLTNTTSLQITTGISRAFHDKALLPGFQKQAFATSFIAQQLTVAQLYDHIREGGAFSVARFDKDRRSENNFLSSQLIALDFDENVSIVDCLKNAFIRDYACFVYPSPSSGKVIDGKPIAKSRPVFILDKPVMDAAAYRRYVLAVMQACSELGADEAAKDAARIFFGSTNDYEMGVYQGNVLPVQVLENLLDEYHIMEEPVRPHYSDIDYEQTSQDIIDQLIARLGLHHFTSDGWSTDRAYSPFRAEHNPSFQLNNISGVGKDWGTGETYSPYEIAKTIGITLPEREHKDIMRRIEPPRNPYLYDFEALPGGATSWTTNKYLPYSWILALLTLSDTRSAVTMTALKLHGGFMAGALNARSFTIMEVCALTGLRRQSAANVLKTLGDWGFVRDSDLYYSIKNRSQNCVHNSSGGRPQKQYAIETDTNLISIKLAEMLDFYIVERHTSKALAPRLHTVIQQMEMDRLTGQAWCERIQALVNPVVAQQIQRELAYWHDLLLHGRYLDNVLQYELENLDNQTLRAAILRQHLEPYPQGLEISQREVCRLLGLKSTSSLSTIYDLAGITDEKREVWHKVKLHKHQAIDIHQEMIEAAKPQSKPNRKGGVAIGVNYHIMGGHWRKRPLYSYDPAFYAKFYQDADRIDDLRIRVKLPSLLRFKTDEEIQKEQMSANQQEQTTSDIIEPHETPENSSAENEQEKIPANTEKTSKKGKKKRFRYSTKQERSWDAHDPDWLFQQLACEVFCWLNMELIYGDDRGIVQYRVLDSKRRVIVDKLTAKELVTWIGETIKKHHIEKPYHRPDEYFGASMPDYSDVQPTF